MWSFTPLTVDLVLKWTTKEKYLCKVQLLFTSSLSIIVYISECTVDEIQMKKEKGYYMFVITKDFFDRISKFFSSIKCNYKIAWLEEIETAI